MKIRLSKKKRKRLENYLKFYKEGYETNWFQDNGILPYHIDTIRNKIKVDLERNSYEKNDTLQLLNKIEGQYQKFIKTNKI